MTHHSLHTTHFTPHHLSYRAHLTPLISQHSSYATSLSPVISQHSNMRYSSYTTQLIPNAYSGERHKTSHVGLSGPFILSAYQQTIGGAQQSLAKPNLSQAPKQGQFHVPKPVAPLGASSVVRSWRRPLSHPLGRALGCKCIAGGVHLPPSPTKQR